MEVLIVDDHPIIHETLRAVVSKAIAGALIFTAVDFASAEMCVRGLENLGLVLLDLGLPGFTGLDALHRFRQLFPEIRVAIVSANDDCSSIRDALAAGAVGFIPKTSPPPVLVNAVRLIAEGGIYVPTQAIGNSLETGAALSKPVSQALQGLGLTGRQTDVLRLIVKGLPNRHIAERLGIAENTVKKHTHAVFHAMGVSSRAEAMVVATQYGIYATRQ